jgi:uncharacterized protein (DUF1501 family)
VAFAQGAGDRRFVVVILRGGIDGLAAVPPWGDPDYAGQRGALALPPPGEGGVMDLDGSFGLHPALAGLMPLYQARELAFVHAVATPYRSRSHFDGQDLLENGTVHPFGAGDGWLNRSLAMLADGGRRRGLAVGETVPLVLKGAVPVGSWAPDTGPLPVSEDLLERLATMYRDDPLLASALAAGLDGRQMREDVLGQGGDPGMAGQRVRAMRTLAEGLGPLLAAADGPRIAALSVGGWDTHAAQGTVDGRLARELKGLATGLLALREKLGSAWSTTVVVAISEFGRTVAANGSGGTDHGTAGIAIVAGGAVNGGRVIARWPGIKTANLFEGRDLAPTLDLRAVLKGVLHDHLAIAGAALNDRVFPDSGEIQALNDLVRT